MNRSLKAGAWSLALVFGAFLVASCGSSSSPTSPSGTPADVTITIVGQDGAMSFNPPSATMKVGQTVAWSNSDSITHTSTQNSGVWDTGGVSGGTSSTPIKMTTAGTFQYHCSIHPTMVGALTVNP
jgi:plastocyanin